MTGPAPGERAGSDEPFGVRLRDVALPLGVLLAIGLALRLIIAYVLLPGSGFKVDVQSFDAWSAQLARNGPWGIYDRGFFLDYTPGYLYVLWALGTVAGFLGGPGSGPGEMLKLPAILADLGLAVAVFMLTVDLSGRRRAGLVAAAIVLFVPTTWFDSAVWSQVDSVGTLVLVLAVRELWKGRDGRAAILTTIAAIIKPQFGILIPLAAVLIVRREWRRRNAAAGPGGDAGVAPGIRLDAGPPAGGAPGWWFDEPIAWALRAGAVIPLAVLAVVGGGSQAAPLVLGGLTGVAVASLVALAYRDPRLGHGLGRLVSIAAVGLVTAQVVCVPFGITILRLATQIVSTAGGYPYITVNAYNPWALLAQDGSGLAATGTWICDMLIPGKCDTSFSILGLPALLVGTGLILVAIAAFCVVIWRRDDRRTFLVALTVMAIAFFVLPTRVHERYLYPFFALGAVVVAVSPRWAAIYGTLAVANFMNLYGILTTPFYENIGLAPMLDMLGGLGTKASEVFRSSQGVTLAVVLHAVGFAGAIGNLLRPAPREVDGRTTPDEEAAWGEPLPEGVSGPGVPGDPAGPAGGATPDRDVASRPFTGQAGPAAGATRPPEGGEEDARTGRLATAAATTAAGAASLGRAVRERFDRSPLLHGEGGGRLDRLDLWLLVVFVVASLVLRTFRLGEPGRMHFDEVYHARTAAEFLQDWRYGQPHSIYEYTHPHLAKYAIAGGLVAFGNDQVVSSGVLGVPVTDTAIEPRWDDAASAGQPARRGGERLYITTGTELRVYDLLTRDRLATYEIPGAQALALDIPGRRVLVGTSSGSIVAISTDAPTGELRASAAGQADATPLEQVPVATTGVAVEKIWTTSDGTLLLARLPGDRLVTYDSLTGALLSTVTLPRIADVADAGSLPALVASIPDVPDPAAAAKELVTLLGGQAATYEKLLGLSAPLVTITSDFGDHRKAVDDAIAAGKLPGLTIQDTTRVAVATADGVALLDPGTGRITGTVPLAGGATSLAHVDGLEQPTLYAANGAQLITIPIPSDPGMAFSTDKTVWMPASISRLYSDPASQLVHALGRTPDGTGWTIYVVEPRGNSVFADAALPFAPVAWAADVNAQYPSEDRQQLLAFAADGRSAAVSIGQHAFAWRLPGVIAGALMAGFLFLLARFLFRRRSVAVLAGLFGLLDGMFFVQQRIAMNDSYVDFFVVAAVTVFAAIWMGAWRGRAAFWLGMPVVGLLLGLGLASKWVALYAIGALGILLLLRSALGRVLVVLGLAAGAGVLGYMAIQVGPAATTGGNLTFLLVMIGATLLAATLAVLHPIAWTADEVRIAIGGPLVLGAAAGLAALALGPISVTVPAAVGPGEGSPIIAAHTALGIAGYALVAALALFALAAVAVACFWAGGRLGFGPLAPPRSPDDPATLLAPPSTAPDGWLRPGWGFGLPIAWAAVSLLAIPLAVYVLSYVPWALGAAGAPQIFGPGTPLVGQWPPGHAGQTLLDLTKSMYDYHNNLRAAHAASSPWWAWPLDLKPVWFYDDSFAGSTRGAIYDAGNLVLWWLSIPAVAYAAFQAFRRRSNALGLIVIMIACLWLAWSRIDRATFQYHYYSTLPFVLLALAYFVADLWHGPSRRTWMLARGAAVGALVLPVVMWVGRAPLCLLANVAKANPGSQACSSASALPISLTAQVTGLIVVLIVGGGALVWQLVRLDRAVRGGAGPEEAGPAGRRLIWTGVASGAALVVAALMLPAQPFIETPSIPGEMLALLLLLVLGPLAWVAWSARSPRRFAVGIVLTALVVGVAMYPNLSGLPLPNTVYNYYQALLPTWMYPFQFAVNTDPAFTVSFSSLEPLLLAGVTLAAAMVLAYAVWVWRIALAEREADEAVPGGEPEA